MDVKSEFEIEEEKMDFDCAPHQFEIFPDSEANIALPENVPTEELDQNVKPEWRELSSEFVFVEDFINNDVIKSEDSMMIGKRSIAKHEKTIVSDADRGEKGFKEKSTPKSRAQKSVTHQNSNKKHQKNHSCRFCGFSSKIKEELKGHLKIHTKRKFKCSHCNYECNINSNLKRHLLVHTVKFYFSTGDIGDIIVSLLNKPFSQRSEEDRLFILNKGRPTPNITCVQMCKNSNRCFQSTWYQKYKWLCGSYEINCLFCWPCLIISVRRNVWSNEGFQDWKNLSRALERHSWSKDHIQNSISFKMYSRKAAGVLEEESEQANRLKKEYNANVLKNREIFSMLVDIACLLCKQELPFRAYNESNCSLNQENFKEIVNTMIKYNKDLKCQWEKMGALNGLSETIQDDIVECIADEVKDAIRNTIKKAPFFSMQVDEITNGKDIAQYSVICRCVNSKGKIKEYFLGFYDFGEDKTTDGICQQLLTVLKPFDFENKLVAQTYDGASVVSSELNKLEAKIRSYAPLAMFTHCSAHCLNLVLQQSCRNIPCVKRFFSTLQGILPFFHKSSKRRSVLDRIVGKRIPTDCEMRWNSNAKIVSEICNERIKIIQVFEELMNTDMIAKTIRQAEAYRNKLSHFDFVFYLLVFQDIFLKTEPICNILEEKNIDIQMCVSEVSTCEAAIKGIRNDEAFQNYIDKTQNETGHSPCTSKLVLHKSNDNVLSHYKSNFYEIIDTIILQVRVRFSNIASLKFLHFSNSTNIQSFRMRFPDSALNSLIESYGKFFELHSLKNELMAISTEENRDLFHDADIETILKNIVENDLCDILPQSYRLFSLIATIPATTSSGESFSCLNRIKTWKRNTLGQKQQSSLALTFIEKELLIDLSREDNWYENIIKRFTSKRERQIELIFK